MIKTSKMASGPTRKAELAAFHFFEDNSSASHPRAPGHAAPAVGLLPMAPPSNPVPVVDKRSVRNAQTAGSGSAGLERSLSRSAPATPEPPIKVRTAPPQSAQRLPKAMVPFEFGGNAWEGLPPPAPRHSVSDFLVATSTATSAAASSRVPAPAAAAAYGGPLVATATTPHRAPQHHRSVSDVAPHDSPPLHARGPPTSPSTQRFADKGRPSGRALPNPMAHPAAFSLAVGSAPGAN